MSKIYSSSMLVLCLAAVLGVFVGNASADAISVYNFNNLSTTFAGPPVGLLAGQDGWCRLGTAGTCDIVSSGASGWDGNYIEGANGLGNSQQEYRPNDANWSYTMVDNVSFNVSCIVRVNGTNYTSLGGLINSAGGGGNTKSNVMGVFNTGKLHWAIGGVAYNSAAWVESGSDDMFLVGCTWSAEGNYSYSVQRYWQDLTANPNGSPTLEGTPISYTFVTNYPPSVCFTGLSADCRTLGGGWTTSGSTSWFRHPSRRR